VPVDDLNAPLGQDIGNKPRTASIPWAFIVGALGVVLIGAAAGRLLLIRPGNPKFVQPPAIAAPEKARPERTGSVPEKSLPESAGTNSPTTAAIPEADKPTPPATQTITIIDGTTGKREKIEIPVTPKQ
jgi:hypothetical protein